MSNESKTKVTLTITGTMILGAMAWVSRSDARIERAEADITKLEQMYQQSLATWTEVNGRLSNIEGRMNIRHVKSKD